MGDKKIEKLKEEYMNVPIPEELDFIVRKTLKNGGKKNMKKNNGFKWIGIAASLVVVFIAGVNISPNIANALSEVPVVGNLVKVVTFKEYKVDKDTFRVDLEVPAIEGLEDKGLENSLNEKYLEENKKLYDDFIVEMKALEADGGHLGVDSWYEVKTDNDRIFSVGRYVLTTEASSFTEIKYDTIDKKNQILISLPSLFKDNSYIDVISENIKEQMKEQMQSDSSKVYFIIGVGEDEVTDGFEKIVKEQEFYIDNDGKLVISFDEYEVAPGCMGVVEFVIPTDIISDILVGEEYIR